jgi:hypothetical protein
VRRTGTRTARTWTKSDSRASKRTGKG